MVLEGNEKGGGGGGLRREAAQQPIKTSCAKRGNFLKTQFPLFRKRSRSISCTVFYPKESLGNLKVTGW